MPAGFLNLEFDTFKRIYWTRFFVNLEIWDTLSSNGRFSWTTYPCRMPTALHPCLSSPLNHINLSTKPLMESSYWKQILFLSPLGICYSPIGFLGTPWYSVVTSGPAHISHSWWTWGPIWDVEDKTQINHMPGKCPACFALSETPTLLWFFLLPLWRIILCLSLCFQLIFFSMILPISFYEVANHMFHLSFFFYHFWF